MKKIIVRCTLLNSLACFAIIIAGCNSGDSTKQVTPETKTELGGSAPLDDSVSLEKETSLPEAGSTTGKAGVNVPEPEKSGPALDPDGNPIESKPKDTAKTKKRHKQNQLLKPIRVKPR